MSKSNVNRRIGLFNRAGGMCYYCSKVLSLRPNAENFATLDHVVPKSKGGSNGMRNLVISCSECNREKGDLLL